MQTSWVDQFEKLYKYYGPGRLPGAHRRTLGAGYAFASTAFVGTSIIFLAIFLLSLIPGGGEGDVTALGVLTLFVYVLVTPSAFVSAWLVWRFLPSGSPAGAIGGVGTVALTYLFSTVLLVLAVLWSRTDAYLGLMLQEQLTGSVDTGVLFAFIAFLFTFWFTFPLGTTAGYLYENMRIEATE